MKYTDSHNNQIKRKMGKLTKSTIERTEHEIRLKLLANRQANSVENITTEKYTNKKAVARCQSSVGYLASYW